MAHEYRSWPFGMGKPQPTPSQSSSAVPTKRDLRSVCPAGQQAPGDAPCVPDALPRPPPLARAARGAAGLPREREPRTFAGDAAAPSRTVWSCEPSGFGWPLLAGDGTPDGSSPGPEAAAAAVASDAAASEATATPPVLLSSSCCTRCSTRAWAAARACSALHWRLTEASRAASRALWAYSLRMSEGGASRATSASPWRWRARAERSEATTHSMGGDGALVAAAAREPCDCGRGGDAAAAAAAAAAGEDCGGMAHSSASRSIHSWTPSAE